MDSLPANHPYHEAILPLYPQYLIQILYGFDARMKSSNVRGQKSGVKRRQRRQRRQRRYEGKESGARKRSSYAKTSRLTR
jgi:hypothetical protein